MKFKQLPLLLLVTILIACGGGTDGPDNTRGAGDIAPASQVNFKQKDNTIRIGMANEPPTLNPVLSSVNISRYVHEMIFQKLNAQHGEDFAPVPMLASLPDIQPEANGTVGYAYTINENATWPNGLPVTAADVAFSLKIVLSPLIASGAYRQYYDAVSNVITSPNDERRFKIVTDEPYLASQEAFGSLIIYPEYIYDPEKSLRNIRLQDLATESGAERLAENDENLKTFAERFNALATSRRPEDLVGSGPYQFESWEAGQRITLRKQDQYWADKREEDWLAGEPDRLEFRFISDANTMGNALRDELIDVAVDCPVEQFQTLRNEPYLQNRYDFETVDGLKYFGVLFNQQHPLFRDAATRRALAKLVNVDQLIEQLFPGGLATRVAGPVMPGKPYYDSPRPAIDYNPAEAQRELAAAGWSDTNGDGTLDREIDGERRELSYEFLIFPSPTSEAIGTLISEWAREAGVEIKVVPKDGRSLFGELDKGNFATAIVGQSFDPSPDDFTQAWASTSVPPNGTNRGGFANREADQLIRQIRTTLDEKKREPLYKRFQEIIYENQPMIFLFSTRDRIVVSRRLRYEERAQSPNLYFNALQPESWNLQ